VAFGEAIFAKALDLAEAAGGEIGLVASRHHAADEFFAKILNGAGLAEGRHGAAQLVGLRRGKPRRDNSDLHRLLLKKRYAKGLAEHRLQVLRRVVDLFFPRAAA